MVKYANGKIKEVNIGEDFVLRLFPGIDKQSEDNSNKDWIKYLRIAIAVIRLAEYDYLSNKDGEDWKSAKAFLFGGNPMFSVVCQM